jgi:curved DNA-binding protein
MARDYYEVLGISRDASADEIQQAYRKLARRHHPDVNKNPGAEETFKEINEAQQVLKDPETRRRYDRFGPNFRQIPEGYEETVGAGRGSPRGGGFGRAGARSGDGPYRTEWQFQDSGIDLEDLLGGMFGTRGPGGPIPGADQEAELTLTVEDAYRGGRRTITLAGPSGPRNYEVNIPPGVTDGQRIRLAGQGGRARGDAATGDLYLVVRIAPHPRYRLRGRDIYVDLPLTAWEAALGASIPVETPGGTGTVRVPPGSSTGRRLRLRGQGMPTSSGRPGDLHAEVKVMVPARLSERERELFEELAKVSTFDPRRPRQ